MTSSTRSGVRNRSIDPSHQTIRSVSACVVLPSPSTAKRVGLLLGLLAVIVELIDLLAGVELLVDVLEELIAVWWS